MIDMLVQHPLLLLFIVAAIGYPLGRINVYGCRFGVAAVLFVGLGFGALSPEIKLPEIIYQFGLILFVYTVGISSGSAFFAALRRKGIRDNLLVVGVIVFAAALTIACAQVLRLAPALATGLFAGSVTNTPALASAIEQIKAIAPENLREQLLAQPVIGYSIAYPMGVIGMILALTVAQWVWKIDYSQEASSAREFDFSTEPLENHTVRVTRNDVAQKTVQDLVAAEHWDVLIGRVRHNQTLALAHGLTRLETGDVVSLIGQRSEVERAAVYLGEPTDDHLESDRRELDYRRMFVSSAAVAGRTLRELALPERYGALVTRVRRGDVDLLAHADTRLELGDRVRVVTAPANMRSVSSFFGDSYRALSEIDILSFNLGLALGVLVGLIPIPLPGGLVVTLGFAGGPLVVALILSALKRTGPIVWTLPYSANLTLRQLGLVLFLAGVGTRAGYAFFSTVAAGGLALFVAGCLITGSVALATLWIGYRLFKIPMSVLAGMLAGIQTQPAVLGFALERTDNDLPNIGYSTVYPVATITKIVVIQIVLTILVGAGTWEMMMP